MDRWRQVGHTWTREDGTTCVPWGRDLDCWPVTLVDVGRVLVHADNLFDALVEVDDRWPTTPGGSARTSRP